MWEDGFAYAGHTAPWRSGMAQAVAAEALARAGYPRAAKRAFFAVPRLLSRTNGHVWIKLYSFSSVPVLNAQLQTALSLRRYAALTRDARAARLSRRLVVAADALFPRFETACWSRYALDGREATPHYHQYVGQLVTRIALRTGSASWRGRAEKFYASQRRPVLSRARGPQTLYPLPVDGFRDSGTFSFWLSKCAWVTLRVGGREMRQWFPRGRQRFEWSPGGIPGDYPVTLTASDADGRQTTVALPRLVVRRDNDPPQVRVAADGPRLRWRARDEKTPWVRLALAVHGPGGHVVLPIGQHALSGAARLPASPWRGYGMLVASDSSGNTARIPLGEVGPLGRLAGPQLFAAAAVG